MTKISIEQGVRTLQRFLAREWRLALPVALAFLALPPLVLTVVIQPMLRQVAPTIEGMRTLGAMLPWWTMPLIVVLGLVTVLGALALMAMALVPRVSVGETITIALRRLPAWIGASAVAGAITFAILIAVGMLLGALQAGAVPMLAATFALMIAASLYMILLMPIIVDQGLGPIAALRAGFTLYRGQLLRLAAGMILFLGGAWVVALALQVALGSILLLIGRATGQAEIGAALVALLGALISAVEWGAFYVLVALFYRQAAGRG